MGRVPHAARMPVAVARFGILLATNEHDTVYWPVPAIHLAPEAGLHENSGWDAEQERPARLTARDLTGTVH